MIQLAGHETPRPRKPVVVALPVVRLAAQTVRHMVRPMRHTLRRHDARVGNGEHMRCVRGSVSRRSRGTVSIARGKLTRSQVAARLGVSISTVRRMEGRQLHPVFGPGEIRLFDPIEVEAVAASLANEGGRQEPERLTRGELAARVFEAFEAGRTLAQIVIAFRLHPRTVRALHKEWSKPL